MSIEKMLYEFRDSLDSVINTANELEDYYLDIPKMIKELQSDIDVLSEQNAFMNKEMIKLEKQKKIMREALEYYADGENYKAQWLHNHYTSIQDDNYESNTVKIGGKRARQALKEVGEV